MQRNFGGEEFNIPVIINNRIRNLGYFCYDRHDNPSRIELSGYLFKHPFNELTIDAVLIHELCHWYCEIRNLPNDDNDDKFEEFVSANGGAINGGISKGVGLVRIIKCSCCGDTFWQPYAKFKNTNKISQYYSCCCKAPIEYVKDEVLEDKYVPNRVLVDLNNKFKVLYNKKTVA